MSKYSSLILIIAVFGIIGTATVHGNKAAPNPPRSEAYRSTNGKDEGRLGSSSRNDGRYWTRQSDSEEKQYGNNNGGWNGSPQDPNREEDRLPYPYDQGSDGRWNPQPTPPNQHGGNAGKKPIRKSLKVDKDFAERFCDKYTHRTTIESLLKEALTAKKYDAKKLEEYINKEVMAFNTVYIECCEQAFRNKKKHCTTEQLERKLHRANSYLFEKNGGTLLKFQFLTLVFSTVFILSTGNIF